MFIMFNIDNMLKNNKKDQVSETFTGCNVTSTIQIGDRYMMISDSFRNLFVTNTGTLQAIRNVSFS